MALAAALCVLPAASVGANGEPVQSAPPLERSKPVAGARVYIISPANGEEVSSPFLVRFGLSGMGIAPAGIAIARTGHHHLLIDTELPSLDAPIPADAQHRHFGGGQTETLLELPPGEHELQLLLADHVHVPHAPPVVSERISIVVR